MIWLAKFTTSAWLAMVVIALTTGLLAGGVAAWSWQANDYSRQLAEQAQQHTQESEDAAAAVLDQLQVHQDQRRDLENQLQAQDKIHYEAMSNAKKDRDRLRDQLATADVRLSVLIRTATAESSLGGVREAAGTRRVVDGAQRVELDAAHAQRIVSIVEDGDEAINALQACQSYVFEILK